MTKSTKILLAGALSVLLLPVAAGAATNSANTTINAVLSSTISITSSGTVNLLITPATGGAQTTASDTVTVSTNNSTGYTLTLADSDATTTLVNGANTIAAGAGTQTTPVVLANNTWGYRMDGVGGFGAGPGAVINNQPTSSITYAGVPANASPNTLKTTATTAASDVSTVWYSAKADTTKPNGTYADQVTYTATTNP